MYLRRVTTSPQYAAIACACIHHLSDDARASPSLYSVVTKRWGLSVAGHGEISRKEGTGLWIEAPDSYPL